MNLEDFGEVFLMFLCPKTDVNGPLDKHVVHCELFGITCQIDTENFARDLLTNFTTIYGRFLDYLKSENVWIYWNYCELLTFKF